MTDDLVAFLLARIAEDEQVARAARGDTWEVGPTVGAQDNRVYVRREGDSAGTCAMAPQVANAWEFRATAAHIARWDPTRVLAECEVKRRIIDRHSGQHHCPAPQDDDFTVVEGGEEVRKTYPCGDLLDLAVPFRDHPDYPWWAPKTSGNAER